MKTGLLQESLPVCLTSAPAIRMPGLIMKKFIYMSLVVF